MIQCNRCHKQYIGETKRRLKDRFNEHRRPINKQAHPLFQIVTPFALGDILCKTLNRKGRAFRNIGF